MTGAPRTKRSVYMEWAKSRSHARFNLATSGLIGVPLAEFPLDPTGPGRQNQTTKSVSHKCGEPRSAVLIGTRRLRRGRLGG